MTMNCPNCGKPLRPGVRFCGNCGSSLPEKQPASAAGAPPPVQPGGSLCSHCQSPVRLGAKFCNNCGNPLDQKTPAVSAPRAASSSPPVATPPREPIRRPAPARPVSPVEAAAPPKRAGGTWTWALVGVLIVGCILVAAAGFLYIKDPFGWFSKATATLPPSPTTAQVAPVTSTDTPAIQATATAGITAAPTNTIAVEVTAMPTDTLPPVAPLPTLTLTPTMAITPTATLTSSISITPSLQAEVLLDEDFSGRLERNWIAWGSPHPLIASGATGNWLDLKAEAPSAAGVTAKQQIANAPGVEIEFAAQLNPTFLNYVLTFDWDPLPYRRDRSDPEGETTPGVIHLEIRKNALIIAASQASNGCRIEDILGEMSHVYRLRFIEGQGVDLYLDDQIQPICQIANMRVDPTPGHISFTGLGWLTRVKVTNTYGP